jgi:hypothetical protein
MKVKSLPLLLLMAFAVVSFTGCIERHVKAPKFDIYADTIPKFKGDQPVAVIVPVQTGKEYLVEYADPEARHTGKVFVDLDGMHANARDLLEKELAKHGIASSPSAARQLKFTITKVQWEVWAGGFSTGAYLEFDIETSTGYKAHHRVQDGSSADVSRAIGGAVSRAVEQVFLDPGVVKFLQGF